MAYVYTPSLVQQGPYTCFLLLYLGVVLLPVHTFLHVSAPQQMMAERGGCAHVGAATTGGWRLMGVALQVVYVLSPLRQQHLPSPTLFGVIYLLDHLSMCKMVRGKGEGAEVAASTGEASGFTQWSPSHCHPLQQQTSLEIANSLTSTVVTAYYTRSG